MIVKALSRNGTRVQVTFSLPVSLMAETVHIVGDLNQWDRTAMPMILDQIEGRWNATANLEMGRCYRFRYLLDGKEWLNDWHADRFVDNHDGSKDSVLELGGSKYA